MTRLVVTCVVCSRPFEVERRGPGRWPRTCSQACREIRERQHREACAKAPAKATTRASRRATCPGCGDDFFPFPGRESEGRGRYCSIACRAAAQRVHADAPAARRAEYRRRRERDRAERAIGELPLDPPEVSP